MGVDLFEQLDEEFALLVFYEGQVVFIELFDLSQNDSQLIIWTYR